MKLFGLCVVRNESDVIREVLDHASRFCAKIFVYDTGSSDKTWEIVDSFKNDGIVVPYRKENTRFFDGLRGRMFNACKHLAEPGDWWIRVDGDEFLVGDQSEDPRETLAEIERRGEHVAQAVYVQFYYTDVDYDRWKKGEEMLGSRSASICERRRYYSAHHCEIRGFLHRSNWHWDERFPWPRHMGVVSPLRLRLLHYPFRDPAQIRQRLADRSRMNVTNWEVWKDRVPADWTEVIRPAHALHYNDGCGQWYIRESMLPPQENNRLRRVLKNIARLTYERRDRLRASIIRSET